MDVFVLDDLFDLLDLFEREAGVGDFLDGGDLVQAVVSGEVRIGGVEADEVPGFERFHGGGEIGVEGANLLLVFLQVGIESVFVRGIDLHEGVADRFGGLELDRGVKPDVRVAEAGVFLGGIATDVDFLGFEDLFVGDDVTDDEFFRLGVREEVGESVVDAEAIHDEELGVGDEGLVAEGGLVIVGAGVGRKDDVDVGLVSGDGAGGVVVGEDGGDDERFAGGGFVLATGGGEAQECAGEQGGGRFDQFLHGVHSFFHRDILPQLG